MSKKDSEMTDSIEYKGKTYDRVTFAEGELVQEGDLYVDGKYGPLESKIVGDLPETRMGAYYRERKTESEMVTIQLTTAALESMACASTRHVPAEAIEAAKAALAARKSEYELWRDSLELPWTASKIMRGLRGLHEPLLAAAAPQLFEALVAVRAAAIREGLPKYAPVISAANKAIKAACPEAVWREVLGDAE